MNVCVCVGAWGGISPLCPLLVGLLGEMLVCVVETKSRIGWLDVSGKVLLIG